MIKKVYLLWESYTTNELLVIGTLEELDKQKYIFKFAEEAKKAFMLGCFLPFNYTEKPLQFDCLPSFFEQRIMKGSFNATTFGIDYSSSNKLEILIYGEAKKNSDNYRIVSEQKYKGLK